jgi:hypothetical protein
MSDGNEEVVTMVLKRIGLAVATAAMTMTLLGGVVSAHEPGPPAFKRTWDRTDRPVAERTVNRTWMWGPQAVSPVIWEDYAEAPGGKRQVQYFDKSRMEITDFRGDQTSPWHVTNGLLVVEMATGALQTGDARFEQRAPADIPVAGDATSASVPTYATVGQVRGEPALQPGEPVIERLNRKGGIEQDPALAELGVVARYHVPETGHTVADVFWTFMTSTGPVFEGGKHADSRLFPNPFYATGLPITEAYWTHALVGGNERDVLLQCFERRCLTYTPGNPAGWQVESGNVGQHYFAWRYGADHHVPQHNTVVASIPTGPDTILYRFGGNAPLGIRDDGPSAISAAPDGSFWIADVYGSRVSRFDASGKRIGSIDLTEQYAQSIWDVDARSGIIWVSWANLNAGIYKLQGYAADGSLLRDVDLPEAIWRDSSYLSHGITVTDAGDVLFIFDLGFRQVRALDSAGNLAVAPVDRLLIDGHRYALRGVDMTNTAVIVDDTEVMIANAGAGAFAQSVNLEPEPKGDTFYVSHTLVFDGVATPMQHRVYHYSVDGRLLGTATIPLEENYAYVMHRYTTDADGAAYMLLTYPDRVEILRLGFQPAR